MYKQIKHTIVEEHFLERLKPKQSVIGIDTIQVDVPLMIRLLEYARKEATSDSELHFIVQRLVELSAYGNVLNMDCYDDIVGTGYDDIVIVAQDGE